MNGNHTRRDVLQTGAAAGGLVALGGLAGCSSIPFVGGGGNYRAWLPEPGTISDVDSYSFTYLDSKQVQNNEDNFASGTYESIQGMASGLRGPAGIDFDDTSSILTFQSNAVVTGSFKKSDVGDELEDNDFSEEETYNGYTIYVGPNENRAAGVSGGTYLAGRATSQTDAAEVIELLVDTKRGQEARYASENDDLNTLLGQLGSGTAVSATPSGFFGGNVEMMGSSLTVKGSTTKITVALVYGDASDAETDADTVQQVADLLENNLEFENVSTTKNGRTIVITGTIDTDELGASTLTGEF